MGIMTRIARLWKADIHGVMDQLEDQGLLVRQYLREMESSLQEKETRLQHISQTDRRLKGDLDGRNAEIDKIEQDLALALRKDKDQIAKLLIRKERLQQKHCECLVKRREDIEEERHYLAQVLEEQRLRYETMKVKAESFFSRAENTIETDSDRLFGNLDNCRVDDEEIELELLRRKEKLQSAGGAS